MAQEESGAVKELALFTLMPYDERCSLGIGEDCSSFRTVLPGARGFTICLNCARRLVQAMEGVNSQLAQLLVEGVRGEVSRQG